MEGEIRWKGRWQLKCEARVGVNGGARGGDRPQKVGGGRIGGRRGRWKRRTDVV